MIVVVVVMKGRKLEERMWGKGEVQRDKERSKGGLRVFWQSVVKGKREKGRGDEGQRKG